MAPSTLPAARADRAQAGASLREAQELRRARRARRRRGARVPRDVLRGAAGWGAAALGACQGGAESGEDDDAAGPSESEVPAWEHELARALIAGFCSKYPATNVEPETEALERLWRRCASLHAAALSSAIVEQLACAGADSAFEWQQRLRALRLLNHMSSKGGAGRAVALLARAEAGDVLRHLAARVPRCREAAAQALGAAPGAGPGGAGPGAGAAEDGSRQQAAPRQPRAHGWPLMYPVTRALSQHGPPMAGVSARSPGDGSLPRSPLAPRAFGQQEPPVAGVRRQPRGDEEPLADKPAMNFAQATSDSESTTDSIDSPARVVSLDDLAWRIPAEDGVPDMPGSEASLGGRVASAVPMFPLDARGQDLFDPFRFSGGALGRAQVGLSGI